MLRWARGLVNYASSNASSKDGSKVNSRALKGREVKNSVQTDSRTPPSASTSLAACATCCHEFSGIATSFMSIKSTLIAATFLIAESAQCPELIEEFLETGYYSVFFSWAIVFVFAKAWHMRQNLNNLGAASAQLA